MAQRHYFKELRLQQFRALVEVERSGSFAAAAQALGISRTAIWQQIRSLESEFGAELVLAHGQHSTLTDEGRELLALTAPLVDGFDGVKAAFQDRIGTLKRRLIIATTASLLNHELRKIITLYRKKNADVSISLVDRPSPAAVEMLLKGEADAALVGQVEGAAAAGLRVSEPLLKYPFVVACPKKHPLANVAKLELAELLQYPILCPNQGTNARRCIDGVLHRAGLAERLQLSLDSHNAGLLLSYVEQGLGVALTSVSPELIRAYKSKLAIRDVTNVFGSENVVLIQRARRVTLPHVDAFVALVRDEL